MDKDKTIEVTKDYPPMVMQAMDLSQAQEAFQRLQAFVKTQMREGIHNDYAVIPGTKKKTLLKSGAEKLLFFHGLGCKLEATSGTIVNWDTEFFNYCYRATVFNPRSGDVLATCEGSCNSKESKYRYAWVFEGDIPRGIDRDTLVTKKVGRNKEYTMFRMDNRDICSIVNTIQKMAEKRAMVSAVLMACRASDIFTLEDEGTSKEETQSRQETAQKSAPTAEITDKQRKRLFAIQKANNVPNEDLKAFLVDNFPYVLDDAGKVHLSKILKENYETICKFVESGSAQE